jgi:hypothetical protein
VDFDSRDAVTVESAQLRDELLADAKTKTD